MPDAVVRQNTLVSNGEGTFPSYRANRRGELIVPDWRHQLSAEGRVFHVSNAARQTALATGGTSFSDTAPAFIVDVPSGTTLIPLEVILNQGGTVAGNLITVIITIDNKVRYSSGGTALAVRGSRRDDPVPATATAYSTSPTAAAVGLEETLYADILAQGVTNTAASILAKNVYYVAQVPMYYVGPASLVIYAFAGTTQASWFFRIVWAELPSSVVV